ncbi:hypothetical protein MAR_024161 [Mya arenaria]|uniref:Mediator of RNA polymerase II transcription subunit 10 n=1 Tax=Mya arenaria TaxID=6604 RepID=A0ABY7DSB2_MYAAR|nr:hypothetical protein MAR_024161 [Mya arenaria]
MSDRASTETKFNELLQEMNNFFCGLHTLVQMADTAQKTVYQTEKLNARYLTLLKYLEDITLNLDNFISGDMLLYNDIPVKTDIVHDFLIEKADGIDCHVIVILHVVLPAFAILIQRQYGDHLPGGKHEELNEIETASVNKHNKFPERVFSYVDHILSSKPNI